MIAALRAAFAFLLMIAIAVLLQVASISDIPALHYLQYINIPIEMIGVYFHEMSHGIGALVSGGHFNSMQLAFGQGGLADAGGKASSDEVTLFCGYLGPSVWGVVIYASYLMLFRGKLDYVPLIFMAFALLSILLWARDIRTIGIIMFIAAVFQLIARIDSESQMEWAIKFLSIYLVIRGGLDPYIFYYYPESFPPEVRDIWDGRILSDMTMHNEVYWVHAWIGCSVAAFILLVCMEIAAYRMDRKWPS